MSRISASAAGLVAAGLLSLPASAQITAPFPATPQGPATPQSAPVTVTPSPLVPAPAPTTPPAAPSGPAPFTVYGIQLNAQVEAGVTFNPSTPSDGINFGHLFTDRANQLVMNQLLLTAQKAIDPKATTVNFGFDVQVLYGTDARFVHYLGEFNDLTDSRYQLSLLNANIQAHLPYLVKGGIDLKLGQFVTPIGYETIDPSTDPFYTHSYIFNFGLPFVQTGGYAVAHVSDKLDLYLGGDSGVNTTLGGGDNNSAPAVMGGFALTLMGGNLTVLALTHVGPENPSSVVPNADSYMRSLSDIVVTYKASDKLTLTTELDWARDAYGLTGRPVNGFGIAQYVGYALNDHVALNGRAELFRDDNGFFVAGFTNPTAPVKVLGGVPATGVVGYGPNTYSELTLGVTWKPSVPAPVATLLVRPEVRWDHGFGNPAFNAGKDRNAVTIAGDIVLGF